MNNTIHTTRNIKSSIFKISIFLLAVTLVSFLAVISHYNFAYSTNILGINFILYTFVVLALLFLSKEYSLIALIVSVSFFVSLQRAPEFTVLNNWRIGSDYQKYIESKDPVKWSGDGFFNSYGGFYLIANIHFQSFLEGDSYLNKGQCFNEFYKLNSNFYLINSRC